MSCTIMHSDRKGPTGVELHLAPDEMVVSKADLHGRITYANSAFCRISGYAEEELVGSQHNLIRHPAMPACMFELLWRRLKEQREVFAYILNLAKQGEHYWVFAHITPSFDANGAVVGYHSNRRAPHDDALAKVQALYSELRSEELRHDDRAAGMRASADLLSKRLRAIGVTYEQFVFSLSANTRLSSTE